MKALTPYLTWLVISFLPLMANAQRDIVVQFNETGQITFRMPEVVTTKDKLWFVVTGTDENKEARIAAAYMRYLETLNNLNLQKDDTHAILLNAGIENLNNAITMLEDAKRIIAKRLKEFLNDPYFGSVISKSRDKQADLIKIETFKPDDKPTYDLLLPKITELIDPFYAVEIDFNGGMQPDNSRFYPCVIPLELNRSEKKNSFTTGGITNNCCTVTWKNNTAFNTKDLGFTSSFQMNFRLRLRNNVFAALEKQLAELQKNKLIPPASVRADAFKIVDDINELKPKYKELFAWIDDRLAKGKSNPAMEAKIKNTPAELAQLKADLNALTKKRFGSDLSVSKLYIRWLIELSWLTRGIELTANPLQIGTNNGIKSQLDAATKELASVTQMLADVNQKIAMAENVSKSGNGNCCGTQNLTALLDEMKKLQQERTEVAVKLESVQKKVDGLKRQFARVDQASQADKRTILTDSLLYTGLFDVNKAKSKLWWPNQPGHIFMRNHNALADFQIGDMEVKREINELQRMDIVVYNSDPKNKFILQTTFTPVSTDMDLLSAEVSETIPGGKGEGLVPIPKEEIFALVSRLLKFASAYENGVLTMPLLAIKDKTPDLQTVKVSHSNEKEAPQQVSYQITDPATVKNVNSENTAFTYRFNKLYRFRFKAGVAYSWLQRRSYTIDAMNNASYTNTLAGLAPIFGVQIFFSRLDIQKPKLFPGSLYPHLYIGYIFSDAPLNNFLLGGGFEIFSGFSMAGGVHLGKNQRLTLRNGILGTRDYYDVKPFISVNIGLEAFKAIFNSAKPATNPFAK